MIAKSEGFEIGHFRVPSFELNEGELIRICLSREGCFFELEMELVEIFTGVVTHPKLLMYQQMEFVKHIRPNRFREVVFPLTVGHYLSKNGNATVEEFKNTFELDWISAKTEVDSLAGNPRKWLSLISTLSKTDKIVFDLVGQDPVGAEKTMKFVERYIEKGGAAILLDVFDAPELKLT